VEKNWRGEKKNFTLSAFSMAWVEKNLAGSRRKEKKQ